jgi:hypothetical protein
MNRLRFLAAISAHRRWVIVSPCMACLLLCVATFWALATRFCSISAFLTSEFLPCFLISFLPFLCLKRLVCAKLFAKLGCCRTLCSFLSYQVVNSSHRFLTLLLSKLTPGTVKPLTHSEKVFPMGPCSTTDGGPPCLSLVLYPEDDIG